MMSLTYELNGRNDKTVMKENMGILIGKGASGIKRVISNSWKMYERVQSSEKRVEEEKPKLRVVLKEHDEGVQAEIISESVTLQKLAQRSLDNHIGFVLKKNELATQHFVIELDKRLIGKLVGKKGSGIKRILNDIVYHNKRVAIHKDDVQTAKTARLFLNDIELDTENTQGLIDFVSKKQNCSFLGWPPSPEDEYENHLLLTLSFKHDADPFSDKSLYIERFSSVIVDRVSQIKSEDEDQMDEINECLGFDEE